MTTIDASSSNINTNKHDNSNRNTNANFSRRSIFSTGTTLLSYRERGNQ